MHVTYRFQQPVERSAPLHLPSPFERSALFLRQSAALRLAGVRQPPQPLTYEVCVPASTSNLGAGFDCLGMALDFWLRARLVPGDGPPRYTGRIAGLDPAHDIIWSELRPRAEAGNRRLEVHSDIPLSRGLGSSAAAMLAMLALRDLVDGTTRSAEELFRDAATREGHPDNAAPCTLGGAVLAVTRPDSDTPLLTRVTPHPTIGVALAVPERTVETRKARAVLPDRVPSRDLVAQASRAAALVLGLERGDADLIAAGMDDCYAVPRRAPLIPGFEEARHAASEAGAFGMTISGSGSTLIALTTKERAREIASAMARAVSEAGNPTEPMTPKICPKGLQISSYDSA